jgi:uncharacterized protein YceK
MKKLVIALLVVMLFGCGAIKETVKNSDFYYFGVNTKMVKEANYWKVATGALASVAVHTAGHRIYAQINNMNLRQEGLEEWLAYGYSAKQSRECAQAGLALQNGIGLILTSIPYTRKSDFTKGYVVSAWTETAFSPLISNDLNSSNEHGGNRDWEYGINLFVATHNMLRVNWYKD